MKKGSCSVRVCDCGMNSSGSAMGLVAGAFEGGYVLSGCIKRAEFLDNTEDCHFSTRYPSYESYVILHSYLFYFYDNNNWICLKSDAFINSLYWALT